MPLRGREERTAGSVFGLRLRDTNTPQSARLSAKELAAESGPPGSRDAETSTDGAREGRSVDCRHKEVNTEVTAIKPVPTDAETVKAMLLGVGCPLLSSEGEGLLCMQIAHGEEYWRSVAEMRREALAEALAENEALHAECAARAEREARLERRVEEYAQLAERGQYYASLLSQALKESDSEEEKTEPKEVS